MDLNAKVDVNCGRKDGLKDGWTDRHTENWMPISHLAKAGATKTAINFHHACMKQNLLITILLNFLLTHPKCSIDLTQKYLECHALFSLIQFETKQTCY